MKSIYIETERLIIRNYKPSDLDAVCLYLRDEEQMYYLPESFDTKEDIETFMNDEGHKYFMITLKDSDMVIGHLSFFPFFGKHSYEIGWIFNKDFTGEGYAYEAAYTLMDYGFKEEGIHRIIATAQPNNEASWRLMEKLEMRKEAHFKECIPFEDTWWDELYYAILKEEWMS